MLDMDKIIIKGLEKVVRNQGVIAAYCSHLSLEI
ncbi:Uncharacterised protein [Turicibacter sanguinis]|nr:Uncharacterised protein [Turicibacter sanguinis]